MKKTLNERLAEKISLEPMSGCWLWIGGRDTNGYGYVWNGSKVVKAQRLIWELEYGSIPNGALLDHICHNRACVNPQHSRLATSAENIQNSKKRATNKSGYKGVFQRKDNQRWSVSITANYRRISLGCFGTKEAAFHAYCEAAKRYHGEFANFGDVS